MSEQPPPPPPPRQSPSAAPGAGLPPGMKQVVHPATGHELAGFGDRLLALLVDSLVHFVLMLPLYVVFFVVMIAGLGSVNPGGASGSATFGIGMFVLFGLAALLWAAALFGYLVWSIGGPAGQTLGKHLTRVRVVDENSGASIGYGRAALREILGKWLSGALLYLGYLWMLWDPKKKTWHDMIATSQVVKLPATEEVSIARWWALARGRPV